MSDAQLHTLVVHIGRVLAAAHGGPDSFDLDEWLQQRRQLQDLIQQTPRPAAPTHAMLLAIGSVIAVADLQLEHRPTRDQVRAIEALRRQLQRTEADNAP